MTRVEMFMVLGSHCWHNVTRANVFNIPRYKMTRHVDTERKRSVENILA